MPELDPALIALFQVGGLGAFDRQLALAELVEDRDWQFDQDRGTLRFGTDIELPAQVLGSVSFQSGTWLWAWANPSLRPELTLMAQALQREGEARGITLLTQAQLDAESVGGGLLLSIVAAGLIDADACYRCPHAAGELLLAIRAPQLRVHELDAESRVPLVIGRCIESLPIPIRREGVVGYLRSLGLDVTEDAAGVYVGDGSRTAVLFDELGRLSELRGQVRPPEA
jgi:hypothetical protein